MFFRVNRNRPYFMKKIHKNKNNYPSESAGFVFILRSLFVKRYFLRILYILFPVVPPRFSAWKVKKIPYFSAPMTLIFIGRYFAGGELPSVLPSVLPLVLPLVLPFVGTKRQISTWIIIVFVIKWNKRSEKNAAPRSPRLPGRTVRNSRWSGKK